MEAFRIISLHKGKKLCFWGFGLAAVFTTFYLYTILITSKSMAPKSISSSVEVFHNSVQQVAILNEVANSNSVVISNSTSSRIVTSTTTTTTTTTTTPPPPKAPFRYVVKRPAPVPFGKRISRFYEGALVPLTLLRDPKAFEKYKAYLAAKEPELPLQTKVVIILTNHRSGSSFFGELFNQHPDAFYSFEPLIGTAPGQACGNFEEQIDIVKDMARCIVPDWNKSYTKIGITKKEIWKTRNLYICAMRKFCFSSFTKELCEPRHCPRSERISASKQDCSRSCGKFNPNLVQNDCRKKKMVVMKLIRFCDINKLKFLITELHLDLKIVHLIRDPRGIAYSRHMLHKPKEQLKEDLAKSLRFTCSKQANNSWTGIFDVPDWLKGRYKFVRYEDTALFPYQKAQEVYDFVGLEMTKGIFEWIFKNTAQHPPGMNVSESILPSGDLKATNLLLLNIRKQQRNPWSHTRISSTVVQKWKYHLPYQVVKNVQSVCQEIMNLAGYLNVVDPEQYLNKTVDYIKEYIPPV